jgi:hypothetical protein
MSDRTYYSEEAKAKAKRKNLMAAGEALLAGIILGALGGLLVSPQTAKMRKQLQRGIDLGLDRAEDEASDFRKMLSKRMKKGRKQVLKLAHDTEDSADDLLSMIRKRFA